ncbi:MAG TPA: hypothetical protein DCK98_11300 [Chloroflexi bacterium]|jgi:hypothetical protein|nr:hypothetical protein [Chloroflexota bacterium]HAL28938.1 hypothetical protein [Chloroflexota bacterium]
MSRTATALAIRSSSLVAIALFLSWYALLGGWRALHEALPEAAALAPAPILTSAGDSTEMPSRSVIALALLVAAGALVLLARRARTRRLSAKRGDMTSPNEGRLWADHLAWLAAISEEAKARRLREMMDREVVLVGGGARPQGAQDGLRAGQISGRGV